uniref:protein CFAP20DC isoform 5 n=1 Tax=Rattus norvegicus TaxID=10116 RepID=UPI00345CE132
MLDTSVTIWSYLSYDQKLVRCQMCKKPPGRGVVGVRNTGYKASRMKEYNWRNYQPSQMSESELQMLASLRRQQNEDLEDTGAPHGLSASQVDNCNVSISTSSDDTTTWNSCLPPRLVEHVEPTNCPSQSAAAGAVSGLLCKFECAR